jgi:hypothetical protein
LRLMASITSPGVSNWGSTSGVALPGR